jgi:hypothetical protein
MDIVPPVIDPFPSSFVSFFFWHTLQLTSSKNEPASKQATFTEWLAPCLPPSDARIWGKSMWELDSLPHTFHKCDI